MFLPQRHRDNRGRHFLATEAQRTRRAGLYVLIAAQTLLGVLLASVILDGQPSPREARGSLEARRVHQAFEQGGIPAAAAVFGKYRALEGFGNHIAIHENVVGLIVASHLVLSGYVRSERSVLSADQRHVNTEFAVTIQRLFKGGGTLNPGREIVVNVPGGRLEFPNGTSAEVVLSSGEPPLRVGGLFVLFLEFIDNPEVAVEKGRLGTFVPTNGEGVFEVVGAPATIVPYLEGRPVGEQLREFGATDRAFARLEKAVLDAHSIPGGKTLNPN